METKRARRMVKNYLHNKVSWLHINCVPFKTKNYAVWLLCGLCVGYEENNAFFTISLTQFNFSLQAAHVAQRVAPALLKRCHTPTSTRKDKYNRAISVEMQRIRKMYEIISPEGNGISFLSLVASIFSFFGLYVWDFCLSPESGI